MVLLSFDLVVLGLVVLMGLIVSGVIVSAILIVSGVVTALDLGAAIGFATGLDAIC